MKLPKPSEFGKYLLADGSIIYPSGKDYHMQSGELVKMPNAGKFMLWRKTGKAVGEFALTDKLSMIYFYRPNDALRYL